MEASQPSEQDGTEMTSAAGAPRGSAVEGGSDPRAELTTRVIAADDESGFLPPGRDLGVASIHARLEARIAACTDPFLAEALRAAQARLVNAEERYQLEREIGRGGMARVWAVKDRDLGREVAIKLLEDGNEAEPADVARFVREAQIAGALEHPNIVPIHELGCTTGGELFIAMRRIDGESLAEILKRIRRHHGLLDSGFPRDPDEDAKAATQFDLPGRLRALLRVCDAISYAHDRGVVHRDLKPANVMVGPFGDVVVMDWGVARMLARGVGETRRDVATPPPDPLRTPAEAAGAVTQSDTIIGTPSYLAPERLDVREPIGKQACRADVYSLGAVLYELVTLRPPYPIEDGKKALQLLEHGPPPKPVRDQTGRAVPPALTAIIQHAMARDSQARYGTADELARDIRAWLEHRDVSVYSAPFWSRGVNWVRRNPSTSVALIGLVVTLFVTAASYVERADAAVRQARMDAARVAALEGQMRAARDARLATEERNQALQREAIRAEADRLRARFPFEPESTPGTNRTAADRIPVYNRILALDPSDDRTRLNLAISRLQVDDPVAALSEVDVVLSHDRANHRALRLYATIAEFAAHPRSRRDSNAGPDTGCYREAVESAVGVIQAGYGDRDTALRELRLRARSLPATATEAEIEAVSSAIQARLDRWISLPAERAPIPASTAYLLRAWYLATPLPIDPYEAAGPYDPLIEQPKARCRAFRGMLTNHPQRLKWLQEATREAAGDPSIWYALAVYWAAADPERALTPLRSAFDAGFRTSRWPLLAGNPSWQPLHDTDAYRAWLADESARLPE